MHLTNYKFFKYEYLIFGHLAKLQKRIGLYSKGENYARPYILQKTESHNYAKKQV